MKVLFVQDSSPCIRNIKYAEALQQRGVQVYLLYRDKSPDQGYGRGNSFYAGLYRFKWHLGLTKKVQQLVKELKIELIHYHNQPDVLGAQIIKSRPGVPVVFDCHDFMSFKHHLSPKERAAEKTCNEEASGVVYPSARYMQEAMGYYQFTPRRLVFGNYFPRTQLLEPAAMLPKLSAIDHKIHLVYQGRLAEKKSDHRYIVNQLAGFPAGKYVIHIFPSNSKEFADYRALPQVVLERKLPYAELIKAISAMDYGLVMFQDTIAAKLPAIRYAFGNKTYDYLCAGLPIMVQDCLDEVRDFVQEQQVGVVVPRDWSQDLPDEQGYNKLVNRVLEVREQFSMEAQVERLLEFYQTCRSACHA